MLKNVYIENTRQYPGKLKKYIALTKSSTKLYFISFYQKNNSSHDSSIPQTTTSFLKPLYTMRNLKFVNYSFVSLIGLMKLHWLCLQTFYFFNIDMMKLLTRYIKWGLVIVWQISYLPLRLDKLLRVYTLLGWVSMLHNIKIHHFI